MMHVINRAGALLVAAAVLLLVPAHAQQKPADKWDVAAPFGPTTKLSFDTSEGTWMNLDVSPDGKRIVFDRHHENSNIVLIERPRKP